MHVHSIRRHLGILVTGLLVCACAQPDPAAAGSAPERPRSGVPAAWPGAGWHRAALADPHDPGPRDRGHGVVHHALDPVDGHSGRVADTAVFRSESTPGAPVVGALVTSLSPDGTVDLAVWTPVPVTAEPVEYGYEESGLPFDSVDTATGRHRVILGYTTDGQPLHGWAVVDDRLRRSAWTDLFIELPLYFLDEGARSFHAAPAGPALEVPPALAAGRFDMTAVEARWPWLRVKVEYPGTECEAGTQTQRSTGYYWIRALDDRGRPRVFYYTRGC